MTTPQPGAALTPSEMARRRWTQPAVLDQRVEMLALLISRRVSGLPGLTLRQRASLIAAIDTVPVTDD